MTSYGQMVIEAVDFEQDFAKLRDLIRTKYADPMDVLDNVNIGGVFVSNSAKEFGDIKIKPHTPYLYVFGVEPYFDEILKNFKKNKAYKSPPEMSSSKSDELFQYIYDLEIDSHSFSKTVTDGIFTFIPCDRQGLAQSDEIIKIDTWQSNQAEKRSNLEEKKPTDKEQQQKKQLSKARQALVDRVLSRLDAGAMPWDNGMQGISAMPYNAVSGAKYRGMNALTLMLTFKQDPRWMTFNQAKDNGYTVKKGAKGVPIELYKTIDKRTGKDADMPAILEEIKNMTFAERQEFKRKNLQSFARGYYVFNASDIHGIEPYRAPELTPADVSKRNTRIERVIKDSQCPILYDGNGRNYYSPSSDSIHLTERAAFKSDEFFYNTALHEMAHSTGHSSRLDRTSGKFGSQAYAREELVAEIASVLIAAELGLDWSDRVIENSAEYVRSWAKDIREDPQTFIDAAFDASKATDYICDRGRRRERTAQPQEKTQKENLPHTPQAPQQQHRKPLMVNFYGGPGCGKTTAAHELTAALKKAGYNVEYVSEYATELVRENRADDLKIQQNVTDEQYRRFDRIRNSADVIVTDSPILLGLVYGDGKIDAEYKKQIRSYYDSFDNFNMLVTRPKDATFQTEGRVHDEKQSIELDGEIKSMLDTQGVFYGSYKRDDIAKTVERIGQTYARLYGEQIGKTQKESNAATPPAPTQEPYTFKTNLDNIPDAMKALPNWIAFRTHEVYDEKDKEWKLKKVPITPNQPRAVSSSQYLKWADHSDPNTWSSFDNAVSFAKRWKLDGLAFAMSGSGMTCIDLDHHLDEHGKPSELAQKFIDAANNTYIEKSVSGRGLHIFYAGKSPEERQNRNIGLDLEVYDDRRFMSMTGDLYGNAPKAINPPSAELNTLLKSYLAKVQQYAAPSMPLGMDDNALIDKIRSSKVGRDFDALMRGENLCNDHSVSDFKLCNMLAFFSGGDAAQVERIFRSSGLYRPQKGDAYARRTAEKACSTLSKRYDPTAYSARSGKNTKKNGGKPRGNGGSGSSGR